MPTPYRIESASKDTLPKPGARTAEEINPLAMAALRSAIEKDHKFALVIVGDRKSRVLASSAGDDVQTARFLESAARWLRNNN